MEITEHALAYNLGRWTTDELLEEILRRTAADGPALQLLETIVIRARLAEGDHRFSHGDAGQSADRLGISDNGLPAESNVAVGED
jgi:hypothetical protein